MAVSRQTVRVNISQFEILPNELWFHIFNYLSSFEIFKAFFDLNNQRLEEVLHSLSFVLNGKLLSYSRMNEIFLESDYLLLLHTIILDNSCSSAAFYQHWTEKKIEPLFLTPNLQRLIVEKSKPFAWNLASCLLPSLSRGKKFEYLHLIFEYADVEYMSFLTGFIQTRTSFHTMIFEIKKDWYYKGEESFSCLSELRNVHWSRTVRLRLTVQYPFEMLYLLQKNALPFLQHLDITIEQEQAPHQPYTTPSQPQISFSENHPNEMIDVTPLRSVILRHLSLDHLTMFIRSAKMPLLKKIILVDIFDQTLEHWEDFRLVIHHKDWPCLREFSFLICFPEHLYDQFQKTIVHRFDLSWPLNNLAYHCEEQFSSSYPINKVTKRVLLFYTTPLDTLFKYTRVIFNHSFAQYSTKINRHSVQWMCNQIDNLSQLETSLNKLISGNLNQLHLHFYGTKTFLQTNDFNSTSSHLYFSSLRSVIFTFDNEVILRSERVYMIEQILHLSSRLSHLTVEWNDLRLCSRSSRNIKHLSLQLYKRCEDPNLLIDINYLFQLLPNLSSLATSGGNIPFNDNLIRFIHKIVETFHQLLQLVINRSGYIPIPPQITETIEQAIFNTGQKRLLDSNTCQITFPRRNELRIWLR